LDHQVKIRGNRIELGEIESVLLQHPAVRQAVVLARKEVPDDLRLVAYIVCHEQLTPTIDELQSHVLKRLPDYMLPSAFVVLEALPLTPNGKIDRGALPAPNRARPKLQSMMMPARTSLEEAIAGIWSRVLEISQIGIHDNFFALGGHSLLAMQVISQLQANLQVEIPLHSFLEAPTIAQLAEMLQKSQPTRKAPLRAIARDPYRLPSDEKS
jgi:acyl carrier protein